MRIKSASILFFITAGADAAFQPQAGSKRSCVFLRGYLDDLRKELYEPVNNPDIEATSYNVTNQPKDQIDRFGPANWDKFKDFGDEFDGGDGQMGVAGDGKKGLEKIGGGPSFAKSKTMSAKNAWGTSTGYAAKLIEEGVEVVRAQQMENWMNQQEIRRKKNKQKEMTESFDAVTYNEEEDWRSLAKFGVQRNQDFDFEKQFGPVAPGKTIEGTIELTSRIGQVRIHEVNLKNEFMGFADFRAAFTSENHVGFSVVPSEGALSSKDDTNFIVKFKPTRPGTVEGYLVIETEDMKKTWKVIGSTA